MKTKVLVFALSWAIGTIALGADTGRNPIEAGVVRWQRDLNAALRKSAETGKPVFLLFQEIPTRNHATAAFATPCFWTGEMRLGRIEGVVATEAGWLDGHEVTRVTYRKHALTLKRLAVEAAQVKCAQKVYAPGQVGR